MRIRRVRKKSTNSAFSEILEVFIVRRWAIREWRFIEFPVTCMDEAANRRLNEETDRVWDRVIDDKWCDLEILPDLDRLIALILTKIRELSSHISLLELDKLICHSRSIYRSTATKLFHKIVYSPDMIDMTMGDTRSDDFLPTTVRKIWNRRIDTELILIWELDTHVDDDHLILIFESHTVKSYLLHTTKWYDTKSFFGKGFDTLFIGSEELLERLCRCEKWIRSLRSV